MASTAFCTAVVSTLAMAPVAMAQDAPAPAADEAVEVVVTGTRIQRPNLTSPSPVASISLDKMESQGFENVADALTQAPQFAASFGSSRTQSTFSGATFSGLNLVNLRNLGGIRTLTLVNGRRFPSGTIDSDAVDFNMIPSANIARVDVLTGGAGATYGADAVAGVINIITDDRFDGVQVGASYGAALEHKDNINPNAFIRFGKVFDKGFANLTLQYDYQGLVSCADRYLCAEDFSWNPPGAPNRTPSARSGVPLTGRFFVDGAAGSYTWVNNQLVPFTTAQYGYNRNAQRTLAIPTERFLLAGKAKYEIFEGHRAFVEFNYSTSDTKAPFEAHPFSSDSDLVAGVVEPSIPTTNPFLPTALRDLAIANGDTEITWWQRFEGLEGRGATNSRTNLRFVVGVEGDFDTLFGLGSDWNYEVSYLLGRSKLDSLTNGLVSRANLYNGLRVESNGAGGYQCIDVVARASGCVPINPFDGYNADEQKYLLVSAGTRGQYDLEVFNAFVGGSLFQLPAGPVDAVFGVESRRVTSYLDYASDINNGITTGNQIGDNDERTYQFNEYYTELNVPILKDTPFAYDLSATGSYRKSDTNAFGEYESWQLGANWAPVPGLRFRYTKALSVRAPNLSETTGISQTFGVVDDPCTTENYNDNPTRVANCAAAGVPTSYDPPLTVRQGVDGFVGGNANLKPEQADTETVGVVFTASRFDALPSWISPLTITLDRFKIDTSDLIAGVGRQEIANLCYDTAGSARDLFCSQLTRGTDPAVPGANYVLKTVNDQVLNIASLNIAGYDLEAGYNFDFDRFGRLGVATTWTFYDKAEKTSYPTAPVQDLLGFAGGTTSDQGWIEKQGNVAFTWTVGKFKTNWTARYIGEAKSSPYATNAVTIKSHTYHDVQVRYAVFENSEIYAGISNLMDQDPPFFPTSQSGTQALDTVPAYYDVFGRSAYVGFKSKF
ncbi:TonB-dependent receptor domain-containing protein [Asticcacaulis sp. AND118]|uniref:TonB-dependent receptor domain-containing protein n=1 Tax=Asticcacaulis sp. AND118 TaxID=2840468 RepID=UPI001CFF6D9D|nr:TonB-dependent receptor [Asticcacaulis sp. AND118]UDF04557.1 TonB-dependent receptor [Asticcacaulis sp. AND118]